MSNNRIEKEWRSWIFMAWAPKTCKDPTQWFEDVESEVSKLDRLYAMALEVSPNDEFVKHTSP